MSNVCVYVIKKNNSKCPGGAYLILSVVHDGESEQEFELVLEDGEIVCMSLAELRNKLRLSSTPPKIKPLFWQFVDMAMKSVAVLDQLEGGGPPRSIRPQRPEIYDYETVAKKARVDQAQKEGRTGFLPEETLPMHIDINTLHKLYEEV